MRLIASLLKVWYQVSCFCIACTWSSYHVLQFLYLLHGRTLHSTKNKNKTWKPIILLPMSSIIQLRRGHCVWVLLIFSFYMIIILLAFFLFYWEFRELTKSIDEVVHWFWEFLDILYACEHFRHITVVQPFSGFFLLLLTWVSGPACAHLD
jgi:sensor histidine kinase YesM